MPSDGLYHDAPYCDQAAGGDNYHDTTRTKNLRRKRPRGETVLPLDFDQIKHARTVVKPDFGYDAAPCCWICPKCEKGFSAAMALTQHAAQCRVDAEAIELTQHAAQCRADAEARQSEDSANDFIMHATQLLLML
jgi:hypothetical protein